MRKANFVIGSVFCMALVACGSEQVGEWDPMFPGDIIPTASEFERTPTASTAPDHSSAQAAEFRPGFRSGVHLFCDIPVVEQEADLLNPETEISVYEDYGKICMGSRGVNLGEQYCQTVNAKELRYRAVADCHKRAIVALDKLGKDAMANVRETWADAKKNYVPEAWAMTPEQAVAGVGHQAGWVALLMEGGEQATVPATPFCFNKDRGISTRDARDSTLFTLWWLSETRDAQEAWVLGALKRGVKVSVNPQMPALQVTVHVHDVDARQASGACKFRLPN